MLTGPRVIPATTAQERIDAMRQRTSDGCRRCVHWTRRFPLRSTHSSRAASSAIPRRGLRRPRSSSRRSPRLDDAGELIPIPSHITRPKIAAAALVALLLVGGSFFAARRLLGADRRARAGGGADRGLRQSSGGPGVHRRSRGDAGAID